MEGEQIPKATMNNFLKNKLKVGFSAQFTNKFLTLAKGYLNHYLDYINRLTEQANDVCTKNDKKTINAEHIQSALQNFGLECQLKQLKDINSQIKQQNQIKQQFRQRIQQNIQKNLQQASGEQNQAVRLISIKQNINLIDNHDQHDQDEFDYEAELDEVEQIHGHKHMSQAQDTEKNKDNHNSNEQ